jgi:hypothetical protein
MTTVLTGSRVDAEEVDQVSFDGGYRDESSGSLHVKENSVGTVGGRRWARQEVGATSTHRGTGSGGTSSHRQDSGGTMATYAGRMKRVSGGRRENVAAMVTTTRCDAYRGEARTALGQRRCLNRVFIPTANGAWTPPSWTANPGMTRGDREADRRAPRGS